MSSLTLNSICVDCPVSAALARFYSSLLDAPMQGDDALRTRDGALEIWFQPVEDYAAPTWPTQERGQQVHFDVAARNRDAAVARAEALGATRAETQPDEDSVIVMRDPAGHTFCMCNPWDDITRALPEADDVPMLTNVTVDCADAHALAGFYQQLTGGELKDFDTWGAVQVEPIGLLLFQPVEDYAAPTWPTQERGQQMHFDFSSDDRTAMVSRAVELGAERLQVNDHFTVMLDPQGHPFCICDR